MSWTQQVWHVFRKDVREQRWLLGLYGAVLLLGLLQGIGYLPYRSGSEFFLSIPMSLVMRGLAFMIGAAVVLADSPHDARAYWATLPYARSAMAAAKLLMLASLLLAAMLALVPPLLHLGSSGIQLWLLLVDFAVGYVALLAAAALFSSMVRRLRSVLLMLVLLPAALVAAGVIASLTGVGNQSAAGQGGSVVATLWVWLLLVAIALAGAAYVYRSRRVTAPRRTAALAFSVLLVASHLGAATGAGRTAPDVSPHRVSGITPTLRYVNPQAAGKGDSRSSRPHIELRTEGELRVDGASPEDGVVLVATTTGVTTNGGTDHELDWFASHTLIEAPLPLPDGVDWIDSTFASSSFARAMGNVARYGSGNWDERPELASVAALRAEGRLEFRRAEKLASVRVSRDTSVTAAGWQFIVTPARQDENRFPTIRALFARRATDGRSRLQEAFSELGFVLVNRPRGEAIRVNPDNFSTSAGAWLLAPGTVAVGATELSGNTRFDDQDDAEMRAWHSLLTPEWLADAELVVYEWRLTGVSPITITTEVRRAPGVP